MFVVLFVAAIILLGDLLGSFADPDRQFVTLFADPANRVVYITGSALLLLAGLAFISFVDALSLEAGSRRAALLLTGSAGGGAMMIAAMAFATAPLSLTFGSFFHDPGLQEGQAVLPQFGFVAIGLGVMLPAAIFMVLAAATPDLLPRWLALTTYPVAALVALTMFLFMPMFLFVVWTAAVTASKRRSPSG